MRGAVRRARGALRQGREDGFTVIELVLAMLLFSIIVYASLSLVSTTTGTMARVIGEFNSRKRVLMLQREMAEGTANYAGYLAANKLWFRPGEGEFERTCVFGFTYPGVSSSPSGNGQIEYVWWWDREVIEQYVYEAEGGKRGDPKVLLGDVAGFSVTRNEGHAYSLRVVVSHRVKGIKHPVERATEGQARNVRDPKVLQGAFEECPAQ